MDDLYANDRLAQQSAVTGLIPLIDVLLVVLTFLMWMSVSPGGPPQPQQPRSCHRQRKWHPYPKRGEAYHGWRAAARGGGQRHLQPYPSS